MDPAHVLAQQKVVKQEPIAMPKEEQKKGKQKSKDNSHSLLHVSFTQESLGNNLNIYPFLLGFYESIVTCYSYIG